MSSRHDQVPFLASSIIRQVMYLLRNYTDKHSSKGVFDPATGSEWFLKYARDNVELNDPLFKTLRDSPHNRVFVWPELKKAQEEEGELYIEESNGIVGEDAQDNSSDGVFRKPPSVAQTLICLLSPPGEIAAILGDLDEIYFEEVLPRIGKRQADLWYWQQALRSAWALLGRILKRRIVGWIDQVFGLSNG